MRRVLALGAVSLLMPLGPAEADDTPAPKPATTDLKTEAERLANESGAANPYPLPGEIVVTAKSGGVPLTFAHGRDVLDAGTLAQYPQASITETLRRVPGVFIQSDAGNDIKMSIGMRGQQARVSPFTGILVDGIPVKQTLYGVVDLDIFPFTFERAWKIDVIRGGADLRYGPNAYGGVVNFVTEPIPEAPTFRETVRYGSDDEYSTLTQAGGTFDRFGVLVTGVKKGGDGWRDQSEYHQDDGSAKFSYRFDDRNSITGSVNRYVEDVQFATGLTRADFEDDPTKARARDFGRGDVNRYNAQFIHRFDDDSAFELIGWYHRSFREFSLARPNLPPFKTQNHLPSIYRHDGLEARMSWATEIGGLKNSFFHSARYYGDRTNRVNYTEPFAQEGFGPHTLVSDGDFRTNSFALFNEDTIAILDDLDLTLGMRNESIDMTADNRITGEEATNDYSVTLPEAGLTWTFVPEAAAFASYSEGFGTPLYTTMDPSSSSYNPNLQPEDATNKELGLRTKEISGFEGSTTWFRQEYDHKIERVSVASGVTQFVNTSSAHVQGIEVAAAYRFHALSEDLKGLSVYWNYTNQDSVTDHGSSAPTAGDDLAGKLAPNAPRILMNWGVEYRHSTGLWGRLSGNHTGSYYSDLANSDPPSPDEVNGYVPAFTIWDAAIGWNEHDDGQGFAVSVGVTNLLDNDGWFRRNNAGIHPGAPRRWFSTVSYTVAF